MRAWRCCSPSVRPPAKKSDAKPLRPSIRRPSLRTPHALGRPRHARPELGCWRSRAFSRPSPCCFDSTQDVYFVANIHGGRGGEGQQRLHQSGQARRRGRELERYGSTAGEAASHCTRPRAWRSHGDTLWVTDIDVVRGFHARTRPPTDSISLADPGRRLSQRHRGRAPTGALYITDTGIRFDDVGNCCIRDLTASFASRPIARLRSLSKATRSAGPNGIALDPVGRRFIVVSLAASRCCPGNRATRSRPRSLAGSVATTAWRSRTVRLSCRAGTTPASRGWRATSS